MHRRPVDLSSRARLLLAGGVAVLVAGGVFAAWTGVTDAARSRIEVETPVASDPAPVEGAGSPAGAGNQDTLLLVVGEERREAESVTLLAADEAGDATVLLVPGGTLVEIPGFGRERLAAAHRLGGADLVEASLENALGLEIDASASVSGSELADVLAPAGAVTIDVAERLVDRSGDEARVVLPAGPQALDAAQLVVYWTFRAAGEDDVDTFARQQDVWSAVLATLDRDDGRRQGLLVDGAARLEPAEGDGVAAAVLDRLVGAAGAGRIGFELLPVTVFGTDDRGPTYRLADDEITELVAAELAASRPASPTRRLRVQVLNGVGTPGIGRAVDDRLDGEPVEVVLTDNARDFEHERTRILVYADDAPTRAAAERVRTRLGVGTIELSRQPQSVVDLTIVVGADFDSGRDGG